MSDEELHHELGPSGAPRWMVCTASVNASRGAPDKSSADADEGTLAHSIAGAVLKTALAHPRAEWGRFKDVSKHPAIGDLGAHNIEPLQRYVDYVLERAAEVGSNPLVMIENKLDLSAWVAPGAFGTGDVIIYEPKRKAIISIDLKFGEGVMVYANHRDGDQMVINEQLGLYGLGGYELTNFLDVEEIELVIHQPRRDHVSAVVISVDDLLAFGGKVKAAVQEIETNPQFRPGEAACKWCRVKATCKARAEYAQELFGQELLQMSAFEISEVLKRADAIKAWVSDVETYALHRLQQKGDAIPGWKVVTGRSNRTWNHLAPNILEQQLGDKAWSKKLIGIGDAEKLLGAEAKRLMPSITEKAPGKPTLAPDDDSRPALGDALAGFTPEPAAAQTAAPVSYLD